jgi:hypothetical protein
MKRTELRQMIREEVIKMTLTENKSVNLIEKEILKLIKSIQSKDSSVVDSETLESNSDGEILKMFLVPVLSSVSMRLKDKKTFTKALKNI